MAISTNIQQHRQHALNLISKILNARASSSPFTLILDSLSQRASPLVAEVVRRGLSRSIKVVFIAFQSTRFNSEVHVVPAYETHDSEYILQSVRLALKGLKGSIVIVDSLNDLLENTITDLSALFNLVAGEFASTLIGVYHEDILSDQTMHNAYSPHPLDLVRYMATSIIICKSFAHVLAAKAARERSLPEPMTGLLHETEGIVQCRYANDNRGIVLEVEFRRKSGRTENEIYFLRHTNRSDYNIPINGSAFGIPKQDCVILLDLVPAYCTQEGSGSAGAASDEIQSTFSLGLTDKQKHARENVILPYFDAQKGEGGEGGRILYDMGSEDDFDEEEDEI